MVNKLLIGLRDEPIEKYSTCQYTNKIGGLPDWHQNIATPTCMNCGKELSLIIQVYCPLEFSSYHRTLYIFACCETLCRKSSARWHVIRQQSLDPYLQTAIQHNKSFDLSFSSWNDDDDTSEGKKSYNASMPNPIIEWCQDADDWDSDDILEENSCNGQISPEKKCRIEKSSSSEGSELLCSNSKESKYESNNDLSQKLAGMEIDDAFKFEENGLANDWFADEFADEVTAEDVMLPFESYILKHFTSITDDSHDENESDDFPSVTFCPYFISVVEDVNCDQTFYHENKLLKEYGCVDAEYDEISGKHTKKKNKDSIGGEKYETAVPPHGDYHFQKFLKAISNHPQQILRYCWKGEPLNISSEKSPDRDKCVCGSDRVFELQLISSLIYMLSPKSSNFSLDFGTVQIFSCSSSCWDNAAMYKEEVVFVQSDTDQKVFDHY